MLNALSILPVRLAVRFWLAEQALADVQNPFKQRLDFLKRSWFHISDHKLDMGDRGQLCQFTKKFSQFVPYWTLGLLVNATPLWNIQKHQALRYDTLGHLGLSKLETTLPQFCAFVTVPMCPLPGSMCLSTQSEVWRLRKGFWDWSFSPQNLSQTNQANSRCDA